MLNIGNTHRRRVAILLVVAGLAVAAGLVINQGANEFVVPTAIGETNETFEQTEDFQYLERANRAFINLVARTRPSVVQITTRIERNPDQQIFPRDFFGTPPPPTRGVGSGVIVSEDGYILTNNHVIKGADEITVTLADGKNYEATLIGRDDDQEKRGGTDLAVIKIDVKTDEEGLTVIPFGDSDKLEVGEWVIAIGTPLNLSQTVTRGIVSAKERPGITEYGNFIQTDAPINRGNSGGALINIRGELVGINTYIATSGFSVGNIGLGFALPSNLVKQILPELIEKGKIERGWLGISMGTVDQELADQNNLDSIEGVLVVAVGQDSPAQKGGLQVDDIIIEFDGQKIKNMFHLKHSVAATPVGKSIKVEVLRDGKQRQLTIKLGRRTNETVASLDDYHFAGIQVRDLTPEIAAELGFSEDETGVVITQVEPGSDAARKGIKPGYLIQEMEYATIEDYKAYSNILSRIKKNNETRILLYVKSPYREGTGYITLNIAPSAPSDR